METIQPFLQGGGGSDSAAGAGGEFSPGSLVVREFTNSEGVISQLDDTMLQCASIQMCPTAFGYPIMRLRVFNSHIPPSKLLIATNDELMDLNATFKHVSAKRSEGTDMCGCKGCGDKRAPAAWVALASSGGRPVLKTIMASHKGGPSENSKRNTNDGCTRHGAPICIEGTHACCVLSGAVRCGDNHGECERVITTRPQRGVSTNRVTCRHTQDTY